MSVERFFGPHFSPSLQIVGLILLKSIVHFVYDELCKISYLRGHQPNDGPESQFPGCSSPWLYQQGVGQTLPLHLYGAPTEFSANTGTIRLPCISLSSPSYSRAGGIAASRAG
jgi:hypothetical protein